MKDLIYENYKEPLKKIKKEDGFGYYGTIAQTSDKMLIQCHVCGELFNSVGGHLRTHKLTAKEYKEKYGLGLTTALVSDSTREQMRKSVFNSKYKTLPDHLIEYNKKVRSGKIKHKTHGKTTYHLERRNKLGLCPDQLLEKIKELEEKLGHTPSCDEFRQHYRGKYIHSIRYQHGSYLKAVKKAGLISAKELKEPSNEHLLQDLRNFKEQYGRIPTTSDFSRGLLRPRAMYFRRFGTLNNARIEAGLNAVVSMGFGQIKELTPEEYKEYRELREKKA